MFPENVAKTLVVLLTPLMLSATPPPEHVEENFEKARFEHAKVTTMFHPDELPIEATLTETELAAHLEVVLEKARVKLIEKWGTIPEIDRYMELTRKLKLNVDGGGFLSRDETVERAKLSAQLYPDGSPSFEGMLYDSEDSSTSSSSLTSLESYVDELGDSAEIKVYAEFLRKVREGELSYPKGFYYGRVDIVYDPTLGSEQSEYLGGLHKMFDSLVGAHILSLKVQPDLVDDRSHVRFTAEFISSKPPPTEAQE